jgi:hypoxanthine phosphoribosyltransferase
MSERLPHEKGFHISWDQLHRDARALAWRLDGKGPENGAWKAVVAITRGGMAPAMIVARELDIRKVDTISVKSYDHQSQSEPQITLITFHQILKTDTQIYKTGTNQKPKNKTKFKKHNVITKLPQIKT